TARRQASRGPRPRCSTSRIGSSPRADAGPASAPRDDRRRRGCAGSPRLSSKRLAVSPALSAAVAPEMPIRARRGGGWHWEADLRTPAGEEPPQVVAEGGHGSDHAWGKAAGVAAGEREDGEGLAAVHGRKEQYGSQSRSRGLGSIRAVRVRAHVVDADRLHPV